MAIWPFGRRRDGDEPPPEAAASEPASPSAGDADVARQERVPTGDWMTVPPVRTAMAPAMPTTFRVQRLPEILTSHQDSRLSGSLGHAVSAEAPSGTIGGLATAAGSVSSAPAGSAALSELRSPAPRPAPADTPLVAPIQRRLATTDDAMALPVSRIADGGGRGGGSSMTTVAPPAPALPAPEVSRVLAAAPAPPRREPAAAGVASADRPLPIARVVDAGAPARRAASAPTAAAPGSAAASDAGPPTPVDAAGVGDHTGLVGEERVGGFEVDLDALLGGGAPAAADEDLPTMAPPPDLLAPPIQRTVSRGATPPPLRAPVPRNSAATPDATGAPAPSAPSSSVADGPPIQRLADAPAMPERPTSGADPRIAGPGADATSGPTTAPATSGAALPLARPPVQRLAEDGGDHFPGDGHDHGDDVQRMAAPGSAAPAATPAPSGPATAVAPSGDESPAAASDTTAAPLTSELPIARLADDGATAPDPVSADPAEGAPARAELPLVARVADGASRADAGASPTPSPAAAAATDGDDRGAAATDGDEYGADDPEAAGPTATAPTLGSDGAASIATTTPIQTLADDAAPAPGGGTASLPLAPPEQPASLLPSTNLGPQASASTDLVGGSAPTSGGGATGGLGVQRTAAGGSMSSSAATAPLAGRVLQRTAAGTAPTGGGAAPSMAVTRPVASSVGDLLLASPLVSGATSAGGAATPMTALGTPAPTVDAVPLQRRFDDGSSPTTLSTLAAPRGVATVSRTAADDAGASVPAVATVASLAAAPGNRADAVALPLAGAGPAVRSGSSGGADGAGSAPLVQRVAASSPAAGATGGAGSTGPLPLHTAAAAVPSTTDLLVRAGLGERGPDGSFLRTTPPAGTESAFTVQTMSDPTAASPPTAGPATVQRALTVDSVSSSVESGSGGAPAEGPDMRKLYTKLKAELEADIRRQLEAKNRFNRYRP
jgi:hypothetical protein